MQSAMSSKYTTEQLREVIPNCTSIRQVLQHFGLSQKGGNYKTMKHKLEQLGIDTSHFTGQGHRKGTKIVIEFDDFKKYLVKGSFITSYRLKSFLMRAQVFEHQCSSCGLTTWLDNPIPLELDHIDGDNTNNELSNLRLLCPNCHALTPTYRGKNKQK